MRKDDKYGIYDDKGNLVSKINQALVKRQGIGDERLAKIQALHERRYLLIQEMEQLPRESGFLLKIGAEAITEIDYELQELWGFERNREYHRFWELPHCTCPKMDNNERYGTGMYIINQDCPIHGY